MKASRVLFGRVRAAGLILLAAVVVLAVFVATGALSVAQALAGWAALLAAALLTRPITSAPPAKNERSALSTGESLVGTMIDALPDPALALHRDGRLLALNPAAKVLAPALRLGESALLVLRNPVLVEAIRRAASSGEVQQAEFTEHVPMEHWYAAVVAPVRFPDRPDGYDLLVTFRDLTPVRRAEVMRADFVTNASHELRTPLAALSGFIETLQGPARDDPAAREKFLGIMHAQARRMARLIDDLLSLSRVELNAHVRPRTPVDLVSVLRQVIDSLQTMARDRGVEIKMNAPAELVVPGDRDELIRVFENLVENALKYGAAGKHVEISLAASAPEARVAVRDRGPGIAPEHLPRLTERFYRVDVADSRAQGGTGLGLALVKHILNRHRGRLAIESTAGEGATFTVHLPMLTGAAPDG
jgi:two-component system, OmpR family, phosphate regulon sensor histidine kinase PhoR